MKIITQTISLLKQDPRFVSENQELLKNKITEAAINLDSGLLALLLSNDSTKQWFFIKAGEIFVFDKDKFIRFINNKEFLPDSYTSYKNKIGLVDEKGDFIVNKEDVILAWPYKDCILEGSQTNEDSKRNEVFWNEILAPDAIDRLLDPKALKNFCEYSVEGKKPLLRIEKDFNLLIKGNNLLSLHSLVKVFQNSVKLIYIDPPYNTGGDSFGYNDSFNHSAWLTFFKNRIEVAKKFLRKDGSIWINFDDTEVHYAKVICDEIFGRDNFIANIIWQKKYAPQNDAKFFSDNHDHILVYARDINSFKLNLLPRSEEMDNRYKNPDNDVRGPWASDNLLVKTYSKEYDYPITNPAGRAINPPNGSCWRVSKERFEELKADNRIWFGDDGKNVPRLKRFLSEVKQGSTPLTIWTYDEVGHNQDARRELFALVDTNIFKTPKPERLIKRIVELASKEGDYVMDFFAGSGTTAAVAMKMKRKFITCEQMDYCETVTSERLLKVINGENGGISKEVNWIGGGSFIYCELATLNQKFVDEITNVKDQNQVTEIINKILDKGLLNYEVNTQAINIDQIRQLIFEDQKKLLIEILDKNLLYVPFSEIEDHDNDFTEAEKGLNHAFYNL